MPASKRWIDFNEENIKQLPNAYGVYQLADENKEVVYIGEGKLIHNVLAHLSDKADETGSISYFRFRENNSKKSSKIRQNILLKEFKEKNGEMPKLN
jgi:excinuclease UvrABC nuclease subunit